MDELSFARKYRPTTLNGYIGNVDVKTTLKNYLSKGRPQTMLLSGTTGCGKTTVSRLIIKEYMCEEWTPEKGACGHCQSCESIDEYIMTGVSDYFPDIHELDMGDKSGKRDLDSILEGVEYPAMSTTGWKVYMFDEVHSMSTAAQTRLLKLVEEPPEKVLLIFTTNDPQKLLETIRNRCLLKLKVKKPTTSELMGLLREVCVREDKEFDLTGLRLLSARADYVIRDSLNYLERVLTTRGNATGASVAEEYREVSDKIVFDFFKAYSDKDFVSYANILYRIKVEFDFEQFLTSLTSFVLRGLYILNGVNVEGLSSEELKTYLKVFKEFSPEEISYILSSLKRMGIGDIESNLMAFVYSVGREESKDGKVVNVSVIPEGEVQKEKEFRNNNLEKLESAKLKKGQDALSEFSETVGFSDVGNLFTLQKVLE